MVALVALAVGALRAELIMPVIAVMDVRLYLVGMETRVLQDQQVLPVTPALRVAQAHLLQP